jgi:hypothetical protein
MQTALRTCIRIQEDNVDLTGLEPVTCAPPVKDLHREG